MRKLWFALCCVLFFLPVMTSARSQEDTSLPLPNALAVDPATWEVVYFEGDDQRIVTGISPESRFSFGQTANGPAIVTKTDSDEISLLSVDGDTQRFGVPIFGRVPPILVHDNIYFYTVPDIWESFGEYYTAAIASVNAGNGEVSESAGRALFSDGCAGGASNPSEEIIWLESNGFGHKRALERVETIDFNGFVGTLDACDRGVFAVELGATDPASVRILSKDIQDWAVSPSGTQVVGTQVSSPDTMDIVIVDILTGEQILVTTGPYEDRVTWLSDTMLLASKRSITDAFLSDKMTADEAALYSSSYPESPDMIPVYDLRLVKIDIETGEEIMLTDLFPNAYGFLRAYVFDDVIYAALIPDGTAYTTTMLAAQSTTDLDDDAAAHRLLAPSIYAIDPESGDFSLIVSGYLYWTPFRD